MYFFFPQEAIRGSAPPKWDLSERNAPRQHKFKRPRLNPFQIEKRRWRTLGKKMEWPA